MESDNARNATSKISREKKATVKEKERQRCQAKRDKKLLTNTHKVGYDASYGGLGRR